MAGQASIGQDAPSAKPRPATPPGSWAKNEDYPDAAIRAGERGSVGFTLDVGANGEVTNCTVDASSGSQTLDDATCTIIRARARFLPARDAKGKPIAARWSSKYRWDLPEAVLTPISTWHAVAVLEVSGTGDIVSCADESSGAIPATVGPPCETFKGRLPSQMLQAIGGAGASQQLTIEIALTFDDAPSPALRYARPGQKQSALATVAFDVSERGTVENCRSVSTGQERWLATLPSLCETTGPFVAPSGVDGKPRRASAVFTTAWSTAR
ncbi:hypothetical protein BXU08_02740 [Sphingomonas sp. LM7]|nr:hypothetical protein BXU08_02740 [Sphingomonas sp. LM7]